MWKPITPRIKFVLGLTLMFCFAILGACNAAPPTPIEPAPVASVDQGQPSPVEPSDGLKSIQSGDPATQVESSAPTAEVEVPVPTETEQVAELTAEPVPGRNYAPSSRTNFTPTSPGNFNVASGELQLVEFFAFW